MDREEMRALVEATSQIAQVIVNYYFELQQCGMDKEEALKTAIAYQNTLLRNSTDEI